MAAGYSWCRLRHSITIRLGGAVRERPGESATAASEEDAVTPDEGLLHPVEEGDVALLRPRPAAAALRHRPHHFLHVHAMDQSMQ